MTAPISGKIEKEQTWFTLADGRQEGPFTKNEIKTLLNSGKINHQTLVWREGMPNWLPCHLSEVTGAQGVGMPPAPLRIIQSKTNEVVVSKGIQASLELIRQAIEKVGLVTDTNAQHQYVAGKIRYGLQNVKVRVSAVANSAEETRILVQAQSDDVWNAGGKSAIRRVVETLSNMDNPGYEPDRLGMHPMALVGVVCGFLVLLWWVFGWLGPR